MLSCTTLHFVSKLVVFISFFLLLSPFFFFLFFLSLFIFSLIILLLLPFKIQTDSFHIIYERTENLHANTKESLQLPTSEKRRLILFLKYLRSLQRRLLSSMVGGKKGMNQIAYIASFKEKALTCSVKKHLQKHLLIKCEVTEPFTYKASEAVFWMTAKRNNKGDVFYDHSLWMVYQMQPKNIGHNLIN